MQLDLITDWLATVPTTTPEKPPMATKKKNGNGKKSCASLSTDYLKAHRKKDGTLYYTVKGIRGRTFSGRTAARRALQVMIGKRNGNGKGR